MQYLKKLIFSFFRATEVVGLYCEHKSFSFVSKIFKQNFLIRSTYNSLITNLHKQIFTTNKSITEGGGS